MNLLQRAKPSLRSLIAGRVLRGIASNPPINPSKRTLIPRFQYPPRYPLPKPRPPPGPAAAEWRRLYYVDRNQIQHFRRRGPSHWYQNPRSVILAVVVVGGIAITVYYGNLETVPYTKRSHFVLLSPGIERQLGESQFEQLKAFLRGKILPAIHPDSVRVRLISKEIIEALQRGLRHDEPRWSDMSYASDVPVPAAVGEGAETIYALRGGSKDEKEWLWSKEDEILDDKWIHKSRKDRQSRGPATHHLQGLNWEVLVVRDDAVNALCMPGGKIVVFTGLLDHFRTDAEIATVIGHEVGHAIARHSAEMITKNLWFALLQLILLQFFYMPDVINAMSMLLFKLPFSRRMEMEADYIGLLLIASAGYDPRVAPKVYEKLGEITGDSSLKDYLSTHPSSKKRSQLLSQAKVMDEALSIYREVVAGRGVEGFL